MRIFACQHLTRETVWISELMTHANGARRIARVEILSGDAKAAAAHMSRLIDEPAEQADGVWRVHSGGKRADFVFLDAASFAARYPQDVRAGAAPEGAVAIVIGSTSLAAAKSALGAHGVAHGAAVSVPARAANGVILSFIAA
jgi:hypothetical protein